MAETRLLALLQEYERQLGTHLLSLRERHQHLETAWLRLREIYLGEGAQVFGEAFGTASAKLQEYTDSASLIAKQLQVKIEDLRTFESPGSEL